jgi:hypothetical protein
MGIFRKQAKQAAVEAVELRQGTQIPIVDVAPNFVEFVRTTVKRQPHVGHPVPVQVGIKGKDIAVYYGGERVARMEPAMVDLYVDEFRQLARLNRIGSTLANIKWDGAKTPHSLNLNYGTRAAFDGGILPPMRVSL